MGVISMVSIQILSSNWKGETYRRQHQQNPIKKSTAPNRA